LCGAGFATLLLDLLTPDEVDEDEQGAEHHFDIARMADRLGAATAWLEDRAETRHLRVGYFGASTGAAAALVAASRAPGRVHAIVSRGGRPDLAGEALVDVIVPTRLVVGSRDTDVLALNERAFEDLGGPRDLAVVPGAMHLFQEPGALDRVTELALDWFEKYLVPHRLAATG
jgi:putative phosphoribosyl transferase